MNFVRVSSVILVCAAIVAGVPAAQATCTNASLIGVYGITSSGINGSLLAATLDQIKSDGSGNVTGSSTQSINGVITSSTITGTYTVAKNCTGTITLNRGGVVEHDNFVLDNVHKGADLVQTDSNQTQSSVAVAQATATCTDLGVKRIYAVEATGFVINVGPIAVVGQFSLNGTGALTGTATYSADGTIISAAVTGTYTINSNCTGTAAITVTGVPTMNVDLVVVNADREIMLIETDANTVITGLLQM
ncbi:MAG TPA: hypothetical protein VIW68_09350 [Candidatus Sulfotelmatobacter sp.]